METSHRLLFPASGSPPPPTAPFVPLGLIYNALRPPRAVHRGFLCGDRRAALHSHEGRQHWRLLDAGAQQSVPARDQNAVTLPLAPSTRFL